MIGDQLQARFQRLSIWLGGLTGMAAFLLFPLCRRAPVEGITFLESLAVGAAAGLVVGLAIRMAGCMVFEYRESVGFRKWPVPLATFAAVVVFLYIVWQAGDWLGVAGGAFFGALVGVFVLVMARFVGWVVSGFHVGRGYRRLAVVIGVLLAWVIAGYAIGVADLIAFGFMVALAWLVCGFHHGMDRKQLARFLGRFAGLVVFLAYACFASTAERTSVGSDVLPWSMLWSVGAGLVTWGCIRLLGWIAAPVSRDKDIARQ